MSAIDCKWFSANNGWHCMKIEGRAEETLYVSTPIVLADGKPLDFYLIKRGNTFIFTDDGLTIFALQNYGIDIDNRRHLKGLEVVTDRMGFKIVESGAIEALIPEDQVAWWMGRALRMFCGVADWQAERFDQHDEDFSLTEEVERLLKVKAPNRRLVNNPRVKLKGVDYSFDFLWGEIYVDAIAPTAQSVSARLRKAILATQDNDDVGLLFILDDRFDRERADRELPVLGQVAETVRLSDFAQHYVVLQD
jgi:hypothetical protein